MTKPGPTGQKHFSLQILYLLAPLIIISAFSSKKISICFTLALIRSQTMTKLLVTGGLLLSCSIRVSTAFAPTQNSLAGSTTTELCALSRRQVFQAPIHAASAAALTVLLPTQAAIAADGSKYFAPGGTLVDYEVGVQVGNPQASPSRKIDNSNVVFAQDYYYKFGTAAPWIESGSVEFPKTMPFTPSQQRYDTMKKYRERVQRGIDLIGKDLADSISQGSYGSIASGDAPEYSIRPMGLMANGFLASENTGTTNELLLARWYINEINLDIDDIKKAPSQEAAVASHASAKKALNSYLGLLNRVITSKVGDKFELV